MQFITCKRQVSQAIYDQFLSPGCPPVGAALSLLELVHSHTGLPWWASLAVTTATLRTVLTLPLMAYSMSIRAKLERLQPEIGNISKELQIEVAAAQEMYGWNSNFAKLHFKRNVRNGVVNLTNNSYLSNIFSKISFLVLILSLKSYILLTRRHDVSSYGPTATLEDRMMFCTFRPEAVL